MAESLKADDFLPLIDKPFAVKGGRHALVLADVEQPRLGRTQQLIFRGPPGDILPEGALHIRG
jgi:hypothetical protein